MVDRTQQFISPHSAGIAVKPFLRPSPRRKSFLLCPLVQGAASGVQVAKSFAVGGDYGFIVPAGVNWWDDAYAWGCGGAGTIGAGINGGQGGGGGGFARLGVQPTIPGTAWTLHVGTGGTGTNTTLNNVAGTIVLRANAGSTAGGGGAGAVGLNFQTGGNGAAGAVGTGVGGGGGGGSGLGGNGSNAVANAGGAGGGIAGILGFGPGGAGGNGGNPNGVNGVGPGGGGGGSALGGAAGLGADGQVAIFYTPQGTVAATLSLSPREDVTVGNGVINLVGVVNFPIIVDDAQLGTIIRGPWYMVASVDGVVFQCHESMYVDAPYPNEF